ncbi:MAG: GAF domain-containing protein [Gammaproteobacteria bacterium]|nr:GAF domain-containing protein [Gammaproteobacteria bacterium]MBU1732113.1 GAF domain-containing protein [Gammaproteobacteria bacterium]MBU1893357.1 GAF domain-containing protein [Gammaproteobacteria bacterium]
MQDRKPNTLIIALVTAGIYALLAGVWIVFWNAYLANLPLLANLAVGGKLYSLREWLFIGITTLGIFLILALILPRLPLPLLASEQDEGEEKPGFPMTRLIVIVFAVLAVAVSVSAFMNYVAFSEKLIDSEKREVTAITTLKSNQIARWIAEQKRDIEGVTSNPFVARELHAWVVTGGKFGPPPERSVERLSILRRLHGYHAISLLDSQGNELVSEQKMDEAQPASPFGRQVAAAALKSGALVAASYPQPDEGQAEIGIAVPVSWQPKEGQPQTFAVIYAELDPKLRLLPLLSSWPVPSDTAEVLLVQSDGTDLVYIKGALTRKTAAKTLPSQVEAILAHLGQGRDFSDNEVSDDHGQRFMVSAQPVPGTPWIVVGTEADSEVLAPLHTLALWSGLAVGMALLISTMLSILAWRYQNALYVIGRQRVRIERDMLVQHYDYLTKFANDLILVEDEHGMIIEANERVLTESGYSREEALRMNVRDFLSPDAVTQFEQDAEKLGPEGVIFETSCRKKDGPDFPVEISARTIETEGKLYLQCIIRDITERRQAERVAQRINRALRTLSACNGMLVRAPDESGLLGGMCRAIVEIGGYRLAWIGIAENDPARTVRPVAHAGYDDGYMERASVSWADNEQGRGPAGSAIRTQMLHVVQDVNADPAYSPWRANAKHIGYASVLALPLDLGENTRGVLCIYATEANAFNDEEIMLLKEVAEDTGFGIRTLHIRSAHEQSSRKLLDSMEHTISAIAATIGMRDAYTGSHQIRVAELCGAIARELGIADHEIHGIVLAAEIHDLGKIMIPAEILSKPAQLNTLERQLVQTHSQAGYDILKNIDFPWPIAQMILQHHERLDGSGYPGGLKDGDILMGARIIAVADTMEAISSHRPYRPALGIDAALAEIGKDRGSLFDPAVVDACLKLFGEKRFVFSNGSPVIFPSKT